MSECLYGNVELIPADLRDETCTNLTIALSLLMRRIKPGELRSIIVTSKQYIQIEGIPEKRKLKVTKEEFGDDLLITLSVTK